MEKLKRKGGLALTALVAALCLALPSGVPAAPPEGRGGGNGGGGGNGAGSGRGGGVTQGDILGDLWVVVRDVTPTVDGDTQDLGDGQPIRFSWEWSANCYDAAGDFNAGAEGCVPVEPTPWAAEGCSQPITYDLVTWDGMIDPTNPENEQFTFEEYVNSYGQIQTVNLIPLDPECKIPEYYEASWGELVMEVESGRLNLSRTTDAVLDSAYEEALAAINSSVDIVTRDAAGRLVVTLEDADGTYLKTIDSPRENMALYRQLMLEIKESGEVCIEGIASGVDLGTVSHLRCGYEAGVSDDDLQRAASFLAGAADKFGSVGIDEFIYLNNFLGINDVQEVGGSLLVTGYFDIKDDFTYVRSGESDGELDGEYYGVTADLLHAGSTLENGYPTSFDVAWGVNIADSVFSGDWDGDNYDFPIVNFVRAIDDAVSVIYYIHAYELPAYPIPLAP